MKDIDKAIQLASTASEEELKTLVHHPSSKVILKLIHNNNLTEDIALIVASRKNINPEILESLSNNIRWRENYRIMLAICKNLKTSQKISLSLIKSLRIFDIADLTRNQHVPINVRMRAEANIIEKILPMPLGIKITLARRASGNVLIKLIEDGMKEVVAVCLDSPYMTEGDIYKIINMKKISSQVICQIANHPKWSCRYNIQWALIRNNNTPLSCIVNYLKNINTVDLQELYAAPEVPSSTKPFIYRELLDREEI
ncbi:MAG: hypothetical protein A2Z47_08875 [Thermodesulfovibrio sp. RBG_19FT_COMBO_42_12]|nr:MAG: hypothetical protein A2Z47_08875 [Thermodesulfovibrio sp. RBG_19FT_COMBO_42_12]